MLSIATVAGLCQAAAWGLALLMGWLFLEVQYGRPPAEEEGEADGD